MATEKHWKGRPIQELEVECAKRFKDLSDCQIEIDSLKQQLKIKNKEQIICSERLRTIESWVKVAKGEKDKNLLIKQSALLIKQLIDKDLDSSQKAIIKTNCNYIIQNT